MGIGKTGRDPAPMLHQHFNAAFHLKYSTRQQIMLQEKLLGETESESAQAAENHEREYRN